MLTSNGPNDTASVAADVIMRVFNTSAWQFQDLYEPLLQIQCEQKLACTLTDFNYAPHAAIAALR